MCSRGLHVQPGKCKLWATSCVDSCDTVASRFFKRRLTLTFNRIFDHEAVDLDKVLIGFYDTQGTTAWSNSVSQLRAIAYLLSQHLP